MRFPDGPRLDLGFIEFLVTIAWVVTFLVLGRDRKPEFPWAAWTFALYGPFRVGLDQFRADRVHYGALTVDEWTGLAMGTLGWFTLWRVQRAGYSGAPREMR